MFFLKNKKVYLLQRINGSPVLPIGQEQRASPTRFSQTAPAPHGLGLHGSMIIQDKYYTLSILRN